MQDLTGLESALFIPTRPDRDVLYMGMEPAVFNGSDTAVLHCARSLDQSDAANCLSLCS